MDAWLIWLIVASFLTVVEVLTLSMWSLCLALGSLAAMVMALCGFGIVGQVVALALMSLVAWLALLPLFRRLHAKTDERASRTGMDALLGRRATVTNEIRPGELGRARIDGDSWQVRAPSVHHTVARGSEVVVTAYDSNILTVTLPE